MDEDIRAKAAASVVALGRRAESAGIKDAAAATGAQWQPVPYAESSKFHPAKLREAVAYYEIAESIHPPTAAHGYLRALLLETIGDWDEAIAAFRLVDASGNSQEDSIAIKRCAAKKAGTYDELAVLGFSREQIDAMDRIDADAEPTQKQAAMIQAMQGASTEELLAMMQAMMGAKDAAPANAAPGGDDGECDGAAAIAQAFVNHLLDRDYAAARTLLHPLDGDMSEEDLREDFEPMFEDEEFPSSANVFDVQTDMPDIGDDGVAWIYVNIDSENQEAVSLVVARHQGQLRIRDVEFGRP